MQLKVQILKTFSLFKHKKHLELFLKVSISDFTLDTFPHCNREWLSLITTNKTIFVFVKHPAITFDILENWDPGSSWDLSGKLGKPENQNPKNRDPSGTLAGP